MVYLKMYWLRGLIERTQGRCEQDSQEFASVNGLVVNDRAVSFGFDVDFAALY